MNLTQIIEKAEGEFVERFKNGSWWEDAENNKNSPAHSIKSFLSEKLVEAYEAGQKSAKEPNTHRVRIEGRLIN